MSETDTDVEPQESIIVSKKQKITELVKKNPD
jgi:hypothetical protein